MKMFRRLFLPALAAVAVLLLVATVAPPPFSLGTAATFAQDVAAPVVTPAPVVVVEGPNEVAIRPLADQLLPYVVEFAILALLTIAGFAVKWFKEKTNIDMEWALKQIEGKHRESLHSAIYTAVAALAEKTGVKDLKFDAGSPAMAEILRHVRDSVPEALDFFAPPENVLANLANAKAVEVAAKVQAAKPTGT